MKLSPLAGIRVQVTPDYPIFKTVPMPAKRKWGPKTQRVKIFSHYDNVLKDGQILSYEHQGTFLMNPRTKSEIDKAIKAENRKLAEPKFRADYGFDIRANPDEIVNATA